MDAQSAHHQPLSVACLIEAGLQAHVFMPQDPAYQASIDSYFSNTAKLQPACVFIPESTEQVSRAIKALVTTKEEFAIRSGGHAPFGGSNNAQSGVTIDLSHLSSIQYDSDSKLVTFGPGVRWKHIYTALQEYGRVVAGGREGETGVAGFLLGGGNTWFTGQKGFACDNVVSYDVVLADSQIVTVTKDVHGELFRALKGGSNNFGVIVSFTMNTIACENIWGGTTMSSKEHIPDMICAVANFTTSLPNNPDSSLIAGINYIPQVEDIIIGGALVETQGRQDSPAFAEWSKLPTIVTTTKSKSILEMGLETALPNNMYDTWFTLTIKNDCRIMSKAVDVHELLVNDLKSYIPQGDFYTQCIFQPLPLTFAKHSVQLGGNVMGIEHNDSDGIILQLNAMVKTADQDNFAYQKFKAGIQTIKQFAEAEKGLLDWVYLNYADRSQDPLRSYGEENVKLMERVAATYDPNEVFQTLCPGGFKLRK